MGDVRGARRMRAGPEARAHSRVGGTLPPPKNTHSKKAPRLFIPALRSRDGDGGLAIEDTAEELDEGVARAAHVVNDEVWIGLASVLELHGASGDGAGIGRDVVVDGASGGLSEAGELEGVVGLENLADPRETFGGDHGELGGGRCAAIAEADGLRDIFGGHAGDGIFDETRGEIQRVDGIHQGLDVVVC